MDWEIPITASLIKEKKNKKAFYFLTVINGHLKLQAHTGPLRCTYSTSIQFQQSTHKRRDNSNKPHLHVKQCFLELRCSKAIICFMFDILPSCKVDLHKSVYCRERRTTVQLSRTAELTLPCSAAHSCSSCSQPYIHCALCKTQ